MRVCEIFTSIQGESSFAGLPCTFVRLSGCNLRCVYCDTKYSYNEGAEMSTEMVLEQIQTAGIHLVEITGGEPLLQLEETNSMIRALLDRSYEVLIETNGSLNIGELESGAIVILDMKTPDSGMSEKMDLSNLEIIKSTDEVKFVVCSSGDYEWSKKLIRKHNLQERCGILLSPASGMLKPRELAAWIIRDHLKARLNLQLHKYIFDPRERGV